MLRSLCLFVAFQLVAVGSAFAQHDAALSARGQKVFTSEKCSVCHSIAGKGNPKGSLDAVGAKLSADEIREWIVNAPEMAKKTKATRKPVMKSYAHLAKDDVDALVVYLQSLKK